MSLCPVTLNPALQNVPLDYTNFRTLLETKYNDRIIQCKFAEIVTMKGYFNAPVTNLFNNLKESREIIIKFEKYRKPSERVSSVDLQPTAGQTCPSDVDIDCAVDCTTTKPEYETCSVLPDKLYKVGVSECIRTKKLSMFDAEKELSENIDAAGKMIEVESWNKLVCEVVNNPVALPTMGLTCLVETYHDFGGAPIYAALTQAIFDLKRVFGNGLTLFAHPYLESLLLGPDSDLHQYSSSGIPTAWGNADVYSNFDYKKMPAIPQLWGADLVIVNDSPDYYGINSPTDNMHPFLSEDGSKFYVVFADRSAYYYDSMPLQDEVMYFGPQCDNATQAWVKEWITYHKLLCPEKVVVLAFNVPTCA